jgi:hypothetical protein
MDATVINRLPPSMKDSNSPSRSMAKRRVCPMLNMMQACFGLTTMGSIGATGALPLSPGWALRRLPLKFRSILLAPNVAQGVWALWSGEYGSGRA